MNGPRHRGETSYYRHIMLPWLPSGNGIDIGHGGDPIVPRAVCIDRGDEHMANCGDQTTHLVGDAAHLSWFADASLDWVYSSHCLEDFENTEAVLREWVRVLRSGGRLLLLLPDQKQYIAWCVPRGIAPNQAHQHKNFSLGYMSAISARIEGLREIFRWHQEEVEGYNFALVYEKA